MRIAFSLFFFVLFLCQNTLACSCSDFSSFEYSVGNVNEESNILILGEISEFDGYNSEYDRYEYVIANIVKDYVGNLKGKKVYLFNGPEPACLRSFDYERGSQLIILAIETEKVEDGEQVYWASFCQESVLYYDRKKDMITGNITSYNTFLIWLYDILGIYPLPQNQMTLKEVEQLIKK